MSENQTSDLPPTCQEILESYLRENGYDGLYRTDAYGDPDCGCRIERLWLCYGDPCECRPGYEWRDEDGGWGIGRVKTTNQDTEETEG